MSANKNDISNTSNKEKINNDQNNKQILFHDISLIQEQENAEKKNNEMKNNFNNLFSTLKKFKSNPNIFKNKNNNLNNSDEIENNLKTCLEQFKKEKRRLNSGNNYNSNINKLKKGLFSIEGINTKSHYSYRNIWNNKKKSNKIFDDIFNDNNNINDFIKTVHNNGFFSRNQNLFQRIRKIKHDIHLFDFSKTNSNFNHNNIFKNIYRNHEMEPFTLMYTTNEELKNKFKEAQLNLDKSEIIINGRNTKSYINKYKKEIKKNNYNSLFNKVYKNSNSKNKNFDIILPNENNKLYKLLNNIPTRRKFHEKSVDLILNISSINKTNRNYRVKSFKEKIEKNSNLIVNLYNNKFNCVYPSNDYDIIKQQKNIFYYKH